jgi:hypothetical protein
VSTSFYTSQTHLAGESARARVRWYRGWASARGVRASGEVRGGEGWGEPGATRAMRENKGEMDGKELKKYSKIGFARVPSLSLVPCGPRLSLAWHGTALVRARSGSQDYTAATTSASTFFPNPSFSSTVHPSRQGHRREGVQRGGLTGVNLSRCEDVSVGQPRHLVDRQRRKLHCQRKLASVHARPVLAELVLTLLRVERRRVHRLAEDLERESARLLKPDVVSVVLSEERLRCPRVGPNARRLPSRVVARRVSRVQLE